MTQLEMYTDGFKLQYERFLNGCDAVEEMELWNKEELGEMEAYYTQYMICMILRLVAADSKITHQEVKYLNETFGFDYTLEELNEVYENSKGHLGKALVEDLEKDFELIRGVNEKLADAYKELLATACRIIVTSDGVVTDTERDEAMRIMAKCE